MKFKTFDFLIKGIILTKIATKINEGLHTTRDSLNGISEELTKLNRDINEQVALLIAEGKIVGVGFLTFGHLAGDAVVGHLPVRCSVEVHPVDPVGQHGD